MNTKKVVFIAFLISAVTGCSSLLPSLKNRIPAAHQFSYSCPCILMKESVGEDWAEEVSMYSAAVSSEDADHPSDDEVERGCTLAASADVLELLRHPKQTHLFFWARLNVERHSPVSAGEYSGTSEKFCSKR